jgi:uncharacterized SAM-binding protein YcdF (DUF218 family)
LANHQDTRTPWLRRNQYSAARISKGLARRLRAFLIALSGLGAAALVGVATADLWLPAIGYWLAQPSTTPRPAEAIIVFGGTPARTAYGVALYQSDLAPELWHTGYSRAEKHITTKVIERGHVPSAAFHYLPTTNTWSDGAQIAMALRERQLRSVLVVTDWWHSRRALCALHAQLADYEVTVTYAAAPSPFGPDDWWCDAKMRAAVLHELGGIVGYGLRYGMNPWGCL